jgi:hypothetical protein
MNNKRTNIVTKLILSLMFIGCLWDWQYGYYQFVRFAGMAGFIFLGNLDREKKVQSFFWFSSAILINPFIKIPLGRTIWNIVDIIWAALLIITILRETFSKRTFDNFFRDRFIRRVINEAARLIFSNKVEFEALIKRFARGGTDRSKLIAYSALEVASTRVPSSNQERFLRVLEIYSENLSKLLDSDYQEVLEIQKTKAEIQFLKTKTEFLVAEQNCEMDEYSFECMRYRMEKAKHGPLSQSEWKKIYDQSQKIKNLGKRINELNG